MSTENDNDNDSDNSLFLLEQRTDKENYMRIDRVADNLLGPYQTSVMELFLLKL